MDERRRRAWAALELGPLWVARDRPDVLAPAAAQPPGDESPLAAMGAVDSPAAPPSSIAIADPAARHARLEAVRVEAAGCPRCGLSQSRTQVVFGTGDPSARWMLVGEAPGAEEDLRGEPFVGQAGRLLDAMLAALGLSREQHVYICNVLKCRPPNNRNPLPEEVAACAPYLREQLALVRPQLLVALGRFAAQSLLGTTASIASLRGKVHSIDADGRPLPVVVTYHPAYLLRDRLAEKALVWQDLCLARATVPPLGSSD